MLKDLFEASKDRIKNPFISSFAIALIVLNWKPILIIVFSNLSIEERITCVEEYYIQWESYLLFPVLIAIFYTLILPYIMVGIDELLKTANKKKIKGYYEQEVTRTKEKSILAAEEVKLELVKANSSDLTRANNEIESLKSSNEKKEEMLSELRVELNNLKTEHEALKNDYSKKLRHSLPDGTAINKGDISFIKPEKGYSDLFSDLNKYLVFKNIIIGLENGISEIRKDYYQANRREIDDLIDMGVFKDEISINGNIKLSLTEKGREFRKKMKDSEKNLKFTTN